MHITFHSIATGKEEPAEANKKLATHRSPFAARMVSQKQEVNTAVVIGSPSTTETVYCTVTKEDGVCGKPIPKDRDPYFVDISGTQEGCDDCATADVVAKIRETVRLWDEDITKAQKELPRWDPRPIASRAFHQVKRADVHLTERKYALCISIAKDERAGIQLAAAELLLSEAQQNVAQQQTEAFPRAQLERIKTCRRNRAQLLRNTAREKRNLAQGIFVDALRSCELSRDVVEVVGNLALVDETLADAKAAAVPFAETPLGRSVLNDIANLGKNRMNMPGEDNSLIVSQQFRTAAQELLRRASTIGESAQRQQAVTDLFGGVSSRYADPEVETDPEEARPTIGDGLGDDRVAALIAAVNGGGKEEGEGGEPAAAAAATAPKKPARNRTRRAPAAASPTPAPTPPAPPATPAAVKDSVVCPDENCGKENPAGQQACLWCGTPIPSAADQTPAPTAPAPTAKKPAARKPSRRASASAAAAPTSAPKPATPAASAPAAPPAPAPAATAAADTDKPMYCNGCGEENKKGSKFCRGCGNPLDN